MHCRLLLQRGRWWRDYLFIRSEKISSILNLVQCSIEHVFLCVLFSLIFHMNTTSKTSLMGTAPPPFGPHRHRIATTSLLRSRKRLLLRFHSHQMESLFIFFLRSHEQMRPGISTSARAGPVLKPFPHFSPSPAIRHNHNQPSIAT